MISLKTVERWIEMDDLKVTNKKRKVTLSLPEQTNEKLEEIAEKYGMTKSGLVNFLVNKAYEAETIFE